MNWTIGYIQGPCFFSKWEDVGTSLVVAAAHMRTFDVQCQLHKILRLDTMSFLPNAIPNWEFYSKDKF